MQGLIQPVPLNLPRVLRGWSPLPPLTHQAGISQPRLEETGNPTEGAESEEIGDGDLVGVT